jgi:hypothetical protein
MGEYHLKRFEANTLQELGHEVYLIEQLNGQPATQEWIDMLKELDPDVMYYGPLDSSTYEVVKLFNCKKILNVCSRGILSEFEQYEEHKGEWYNHIFTNSMPMKKFFENIDVPVDHYEYFMSVVTEDDLEYDDKYAQDCVFLGMGFNRVTREDYKSDRDIFFYGLGDVDFKIYGNGWPQLPHYGGMLPPDKMGTLYTSAKSGMALICPEQRQYGMINNRFSEMGYSGIPIICQNYPEIDWFGAEPFLNFVTSKEEAIATVKDIINNPEPYTIKADGMKEFIKGKHKLYFEKLNKLVTQ